MSQSLNHLRRKKRRKRREAAERAAQAAAEDAADEAVEADPNAPQLTEEQAKRLAEAMEARRKRKEEEAAAEDEEQEKKLYTPEEEFRRLREASEGIAEDDLNNLYDTEPKTMENNEGPGGDDLKYLKVKNEFIKSDLNSNISKLQEQANRLSRLTKGLNVAINYSSSPEVENLNESNKDLINSYNKLGEIINNIKNIESNFLKKMSSILSMINNQINLIMSALGGYSGESITGGSSLSASLIPIASQLMRGAGRDENLAYLHSSRKRFYYKIKKYH